MDDKDKQSQAQNSSYQGYGTPGDDKILPNTDEAVSSPSVTSRQRMEPPDPYIGGDVNEKPGDANPALNETIGFEQGTASTADLLRARESAEETPTREAGAEMYADQPPDEDATGRPTFRDTQDSDPEEGIYQKREFDEPSEPTELDMLGLRTPNLPPDETDDR